MTYPLGCFPCAFLRCEMWEQKAALEKGIYGLIVGWSWVEPGLGLGDSYGSFAIWDSLQFCNNLMAQPGYSTPAVRPEGLQDPTCRRWRCTSRYQLTLTLNPANRSWSIQQKRAYSGTRAPRYPKHVAVPAEKLQPKGGTGIPISP